MNEDEGDNFIILFINLCIYQDVETPISISIYHSILTIMNREGRAIAFPCICRCLDLHKNSNVYKNWY